MLNTKTIGNKIAEARKKANMSQAQLAQFLFISPQAVGKWERGESSPDIITFNRLSEILGVDLNYFSENYQSVHYEMASEIPDHNTADGDQTGEDDVDPTNPHGRPLKLNLTGVDLKESDFAGVVLHNGKFKASVMRGADFTGADLTGSLFTASDAREANFEGTNLTDCTFSVSNLDDASFHNSILVRTDFDKSSLAGAKFSDIQLTDVKLNMLDLRKTTFENCVFHGVDFKYTDLRGMHFDGYTFIGVAFDKAGLNDVSFAGATLKNVSFRLPFSVTNKYYRAFKTVSFDGAKMDKLTYAALKGLWVGDLSKVTII